MAASSDADDARRTLFELQVAQTLSHALGHVDWQCGLGNNSGCRHYNQRLGTGVEMVRILSWPWGARSGQVSLRNTLCVVLMEGAWQFFAPISEEKRHASR